MKIIVIEGCDGVGKSTAVENIKLELEKNSNLESRQELDSLLRQK